MAINKSDQNSNPPTTFQILDYQIISTVYSGSRTLVYRAVRTCDQLPVVIKLLKNDYPTFSELVQFRNQYTIAKNLKSPSIIETYSLEAYNNSYALIVEDFGGISLKEWTVKKEKKLCLRDFLAIAITLCNTLDILCRQRIIHKDIKPANILINPETKQVKLIDFSIASLLPRETQEIQNANSLEGTLAYLSPEQTGRMNRGIDYRSDFYSLGATFYELLTGKLPFVSDDPMELVHCHLAKNPIPAHQSNPDVPLVLSEIINKLMAKNAENRYQSALGIKHDLEICLEQLQRTETINFFTLGERDISDRFVIPEKLYGREKEVQSLLDAFDRVSQGNTEMMLVAGFSGIGKTAVVHEVHKPIVRQRGYFIKGKYDQLGRNIPFSAFVQAFRNLMGQLLSESDAQMQTWKSQILEAAGDNGQILIDVIPELESIIGKQSPATELSGSAAQNRFNLVMQKFVQVFTKAEHPLVMFLDDLQWADSASLKLLQLLMVETRYLLVLGAYRDNEVSPAHPFMLTVDAMVKTGAVVATITLQPLSRMDLNQLVADTLNCEFLLAQPLTELVYQKTKGNPFFATQFLKALHEDEHITFDPPQSPLSKGGKQGSWQCDIAQVRALAITDDVVEFMALLLQKLPLRTQNVLKLAACIGAQFDLNTLAIVSEKSLEATADDLWKALQEGLIIPNTEVYKFFIQSDSALVSDAAANPTYRFLHDRVQQATYSLIPDDQKQTTHYQIGQLLLQQISTAAREDRIFELVNQLNYGTDLITEQAERDELAQLNLTACHKAKSATAYQAAREYVAVGLSLLGGSVWQQQYVMTLALHELAAELAMLCGDFEAMEQFIETVIAQVHSLREKVSVYCVRIQANISQNKLIEAIAIGTQILQQLGVTMQADPTPEDVQQSLQEISELISHRELENFVHLPVMTDADTIATTQISNSIMGAAYLCGSPLFPLLTSLSVKLSLLYGNISASASSYACHSVIVCNLLQDIDLAVQFSQLALNVALKLDAKVAKPEVLMIQGGFIFHRKFHIKETLPLLRESYTIGLEVGNLQFVGYSSHCFCQNAFWCGQPLTNLEQDTRTYYKGLVQLNQLISANYCLIYWQSMLNLLGFAEHPTLLSGSALQETELLPLLLSANDRFGLYIFYLYKLTLCFLFGEFESANNQSLECGNYLIAAGSTTGEPAFYFYDSLVALALLTQQSSEVSTALERMAKNQTRLQHWAHYAPMNHQHKVDLVAAEKCRVLGQKAEAIERYDRAIYGAKANEYIQEEALANELAAKFYLDWGKEKVAQAYMIEAYYCYSRWGAKAKAIHLETCYPQLLQPILQQHKNSFNPLETLTTLTHSSTKVSSTTISDPLDFASVIKAAQALSSTIQLDELLKQLTQIILQNSGADKCVLVLPLDEIWQVRAISTLEATELCSDSLDNHPNVPLKLIQYVKRTQSVVVIDNLQTDLPVIDNYLIQRQPKSVLCLPIIDRGQLAGILYLKNQITSRVFTSDRITTIEFLCTQAAISLENARLYTHMQTSEARFQRLAENVPGAIYQFQLSPIGKVSFTYISPVCYELYELSAADILNDAQVLISKIHADDLERFQESVAISAQTLTPWHFQGRFFTASGILKWVQGDSRPIKQADGTIVWDGILMDIGDRKRTEALIAQKSDELEQALQNLQQTQLQMIQSEKMSALGNLVAGVAHEINNPVGFLGGNIQPALDYINDLFGLVDLYQQKYPQADRDIEAEIEAIELDYIREDLPKLVGSMREGVKRIRDISTSLRTFSRADTDRPVACNIHDGIDSTIMILKHRLKASETRPEIQVIKEYGNLPQIECYAGQLNQVFMNLLSNAIDALDESNQGRSYAAISNKITIKTELLTEEKQVVISIKDNGIGMNEVVQKKIFDDLFTTKAVGKGTGLGLAIARQIVVEKHGGRIDVHSQVGEGTVFVLTLPANSQ